MSNTELDRARERIGTLREEKGDREFVAAHASKGAIPRKEIEALRWLISQRFVVPETDNVQFALVLSLLQRLSQRQTPATASEPQPHGPNIDETHGKDCCGCGMIALIRYHYAAATPATADWWKEITADDDIAIGSGNTSFALFDNTPDNETMVNRIIAVHNATYRTTPATESEPTWDDLELHPSNYPPGKPDPASNEAT